MAGRFYNRRFASRSAHDGVRWRLIAAAMCVRAAKSPARCPVRAAGVVSMNTLFWKILVTRVKRVVGTSRGSTMCRRFQCCAGSLRKAGLIRSLDLDIVPEADPVIDLLHRGARRLVRPGGTLAAY